MKCVLIFSTNFVWNISNSKKNWARCGQKCVFGRHVKYRYSCTILINLEFCRQIFEKVLKYEIWWKSVQFEPSRYVRTAFSQFRELAKNCTKFDRYLFRLWNLMKIRPVGAELLCEDCFFLSSANSPKTVRNSTDNCFVYGIWWKSVQWEASRYARTAFSQLCERASSCTKFDE